MGSPRYVCIHGHFYQPPRENPWLEAVEVQDSAHPYHDWNERITRECYAPNSRSRLVDQQGKILGLLNNYAWMSFNFGPTLLSWMQDHAPDVLHGIVEGDRLSRERRGGHGNALAQVYNHVIMPLASEHDRRTQVLWGVADFRRRFGHDPEGMWLAETAADVASLEALAAAGIQFTVLAPRQARRWRQIGTQEWAAIPEGIDPSRAYRCRLPSGNSISLFFYDGVISRQVAFERLLDSGEKFLGRLMEGFDDARPHPELMHIATDGESYGHHHPHGDMALAYVLRRLQDDPNVRLTNYGEFLQLHPPEWEVEVHDNSSWSCVHGVERWRAHCGCAARGDWQQKWRGPLREAFDHLKQQADGLFADLGREYFPDPWAARDGYIDVVLDREEESVRRFLGRYAYPDVRPGPRVFWLLEMQRHALLMYTSCGWFFDEISGLETTQCLRYAARAMQLARHFDRDYEDEFVRILERAPSNLPHLFPTGRSVWDRFVRPARVDLDRVLAHYAMSTLYHEAQPEERLYAYDVRTLDHELRARGDNHVALGRLHVRSRLTWNEAETSFVVVHYGGLDFYTVLRKARSPEAFAAFKERFFKTYEAGSLADVTALVTREFEGEVYRLQDLFDEERRRVIHIILQGRLEDYRQTLERLADQDEDLLNRLGRMHHPVPQALRAVASVSLDERILHEASHLDTEDALARLRRLYERGQAWGYRPERAALGKHLAEELQAVLGEINPLSDVTAVTRRAGLILDAAGLLGIPLDLWQAQNRLLDGFAYLAETGHLSEPLRAALEELADKLNISRGLLGWRP